MADSDDRSLVRGLGLPALTIYGVGGMLGGGIYALAGEVAGKAGDLSWLAFGAAMLVAAPTALAYAELGSRYPRSGGESVFATEAFGSETLSFVVGWVVALSGIVSMATLSHAFAGYLRDLWPSLPTWPVLVAFLMALAGLNARGIRLTSRANMAATAVEFTGLVLVVVAAAAFLGGGAGAGATAGSGPPGSGSAPASTWTGVLTGATLAFYAFIGFEDMVNVAEEVRRPRRNLPLAIVVAVLAVGVTYLVVNALAVRVVPPAELAATGAPLMRVVERGAPWLPRWVFTIIALFAVANTALLNFVMASRLLYGMADDELLPPWLSTLHRRWRTPHRTVAIVLVVAVGLALSGTLDFLAATTSLLLLAVFLLMNVALLRIRAREGPDPDAFTAPHWVPVLGVALSLVLVAFGPLDSALAAAGVVAVGAGAAGLRRVWA